MPLLAPSATASTASGPTPSRSSTPSGRGVGNILPTNAFCSPVSACQDRLRHFKFVLPLMGIWLVIQFAVFIPASQRPPEVIMNIRTPPSVAGRQRGLAQSRSSSVRPSGDGHGDSAADRRERFRRRRSRGVSRSTPSASPASSVPPRCCPRPTVESTWPSGSGPTHRCAAVRPPLRSPGGGEPRQPGRTTGGRRRSARRHRACAPLPVRCSCPSR